MTITVELKKAAEALVGLNKESGYPWEHTIRDGRLGKTSTTYALLAHPVNVLALIAENERLNGLQPSLPPRPPEGYGLPRFGLRWNGPSNPLAVAMDDGYWTPWHLADQLKAETEALSKDLESHKRMLLSAAVGIGSIGEALGAEMDDDASELAGLAAELKAENERLERKNAKQVETIKQYQDQVSGGNLSLGMLIAERDQLKDEYQVAKVRIRELDLLFGRYILAMRSAVIDEECGEHGMKWIYNSLRGPGELPPEDERDAQAYFDREIVAVDNGMQEVLAFHDQRRKAASKETGHDQA
jgi:hypothetical protein